MFGIFNNGIKKSLPQAKRYLSTGGVNRSQDFVDMVKGLSIAGAILGTFGIGVKYVDELSNKKTGESFIDLEKVWG